MRLPTTKPIKNPKSGSRALWNKVIKTTIISVCLMMTLVMMTASKTHLRLGLKKS